MTGENDVAREGDWHYFWCRYQYRSDPALIARSEWLWKALRGSYTYFTDKIDK